MSEREVKRLENICFGDITDPNRSRGHNRTLKRILHWQGRIWKASQKDTK